jgi:hypothetical protein
VAANGVFSGCDSGEILVHNCVFLIRGSGAQKHRRFTRFSLVALIEAKLGKGMGRKNGRSSGGSAAPAHTTKTDWSCRHGAIKE